MQEKREKTNLFAEAQATKKQLLGMMVSLSSSKAEQQICRRDPVKQTQSIAAGVVCVKRTACHLGMSKDISRILLIIEHLAIGHCHVPMA